MCILYEWQEKPKNKSGIVIWKGRSPLDGERIALIATGVGSSSKNVKTGEMIQTYIIRRDINPMFARRMGEDFSVCGDCIHRENSTCYVNLCHGPIAVFHALIDDSYQFINKENIELFKGRDIRIGSYGDPAMVPYEVWQALTKDCNKVTGYTHQWKKCDQRFKDLCMASIDSIDNYNTGLQKAHNMGWRTFRVFASKEDIDIRETLTPNEMLCPASKETGATKQCQDCGLCNGMRFANAKSLAITFHGDSEAMGSMWRVERYLEVMTKKRNKKGYKRDYAAERKIFLKVCKF